MCFFLPKLRYNNSWTCFKQRIYQYLQPLHLFYSRKKYKLLRFSLRRFNSTSKKIKQTSTAAELLFIISRTFPKSGKYVHPTLLLVYKLSTIGSQSTLPKIKLNQFSYLKAKVKKSLVQFFKVTASRNNTVEYLC